MRAAGLAGQIVAAFGLVAAVSWWLGTFGTRLILRALERRQPLRAGPLSACAAVLALVAAAVSLVVGGVAWTLFRLVRPDLGGSAGQGWILHTLWWLLAAAAAASVLAGVGSAVATAWAGWGATLRRRDLTVPPATAAPLAPGLASPPPSATGQAIVILCDGTGNRSDQTEDGLPAATNVWKLHQALVWDAAQSVWYQAGVGSDTSSTAREARRSQRILAAVGANAGARLAVFWDRVVKLAEGAFGSGISEEIVAGYAEIVRQYRPGDRIYILGFSRGAYTARCIAGVISRCGLLRSENLRYVAEVEQLYRMRRRPDDPVRIRADMVHADVAVEFLGVFDTVASLGVPLWGWWFRALPIWKNEALTTDPAGVCRHVYHALSMDERRSTFLPTLFSRPGPGRRGDPPSRLETLEQVWFRGAHADIGGGYARTSLSDITLGWMMDRMERHGLRFYPDARAALRPDPLAPPHDELERQPSWQLLGTWPRWHPVPGDGPDPVGTALHPSVLQRADGVQDGVGRDDLRRLALGEARDFVVEARRDWHRTGLVVEEGATYRLDWVGGWWRDAQAPPCGPAGQDPQGAGDRVRRLTGWGKRVRGEPWMQLVAAIAHPRPWLPVERPWHALVQMLFCKDPIELREQLAPLGVALGRPGASLYLRSDAPAGLLYFFANDWWQTASNNSGGLRLRLTRVAAADPDVPLWRLGADGRWQPPMPV